VIVAFGTHFQNPIMLAAGTAGFGRELDSTVALDRLGGIITKSVSPEPRHGHPAPRVAEFAGGMVNAIGLANPGVTVVAEQELPWLASHLHHARVVVSVVGDTVEGYGEVVGRLAGFDVVTAFELNLSCPNTARGGEHFGANDEVLREVVRRCARETTRPLIAKLAPTLTDVGRTATVAVEAGAAGIAVVNTVPGAGRVAAGQGGVSGPPLLPIGLLAVRRVRAAVPVPIIGVGGVRSLDDVEAYLHEGATLVAIGTAALAAPRLPERLAARWERRHG
jgi:dihydroorotate dehydrogenase (NAD+) catalytic subunit